MSAGGTFKLTANDGKADRMIMASSLLRQRINDVVMSRKAAGKSDLTPTLIDIERTHILYVNAHFKPFAAIAYEYNKVRPQSGNPVFGGGVTFSLPQYGDFFYDIVVRTRISSFFATGGTAPTSDVLYDAAGTKVATGATYQNLVQYCEYPGHRLFTKVSFEVNGNPLDSYDTDVVIMLDKFTKGVNKVLGSDRLVGQETPLTGYRDLKIAQVYDNDCTSTSFNTPYNTIGRWSTTQSNQQAALFGVGSAYVGVASNLGSNPSFVNSGTFPDATSIGLTVTASAIAGVSITSAVSSTGTTGTNVHAIYVDPIAAPLAGTTPKGAYGSGAQWSGTGQQGPNQYDICREITTVVNGPQTPKPVQPPLEIWNKLKFWFNDNVNLSIASVSIPFGQRFINIDLCDQDNILLEAPSLYRFTPGVANTSSAGAAAYFTPYYTINGISAVDIGMEMYINNIFLNPEIHDIYIRRIGFSLIRVYRKQTVRVTVATGEVLLSQLKWPVEYLMVGFRPRFNTLLPSAGASGAYGSGNWSYWHDWHRLTRQYTSYTAMPGLTGCTAEFGSTPASLEIAGSTVSVQNGDIQYWIPGPTVDNVSLVSHGINIFDRFSDKFFNQYMPYNYGGINLNTPDDEGALLLNMCLFPRAYQPSGHLNISRARETYLNYSSTYISANSPCDLIVVAVAINFLLITDGSAILRYST